MNDEKNGSFKKEITVKITADGKAHIEKADDIELQREEIAKLRSEVIVPDISRDERNIQPDGNSPVRELSETQKLIDEQHISEYEKQIEESKKRLRELDSLIEEKKDISSANNFDSKYLTDEVGLFIKPDLDNSAGYDRSESRLSDLSDKIIGQPKTDTEAVLEEYEKSLERAEKKIREKSENGKSEKKDNEKNSHELEFDFINSLVCIIAVFGVFIALFFMKRGTGFIQSENRNAATFPTFSLTEYFNGDYTKGITNYFTDTIPYREQLKKLCSLFTDNLGIKFNDTIVLGNMKKVDKEKNSKDKIGKITTVTANTNNIVSKKETTSTKTTSGSDTKSTRNSVATTTTEKEQVVKIPKNLDDGQWEGNVIVSGKGKNIRAMGAYYGTFENGTRYANTINKWKKALGDSVNVYNMSIPTSAAYYMPENLKDSVSDQKDNIDNIASGLKGIINVDVYNNIGKHTDEYIYSRTDHHWQPKGAYYAAEVFAEQAGIKFPKLSTYKKCKIDGFVGTMYAYSNYNSQIAKYPDTFYYYKPKNKYSVKYYDTSFKNPVDGSLFFDYAQGVNCYSAILNVDNEIAELKTDCKNGRVLVIFKDSFGNALVPFLTNGFSKIYVCDFRYFDINAIEFCKKVGCTDLLFAISLTSCSTPTHVDCLNNIRIQK